MGTEIKNTLFRFVTMRAPELSDEKNKDKRFVYRNKEIKGIFDTAVENKGTKAKWQTVHEASASFTPIGEETLKDSFSKDLYELAIWIPKNKYSYTVTELKKKVDNVNATLTPADLALLWNNLFYQIVSQKEFYLKEAIMQLLVANHLVKNFTASDPALLRQLMNAKVVLPKELFVEDKPTTNSPIAKNASVGSASGQRVSLPTEAMQSAQAVSLANTNIEQYNRLKKEILKAEANYQKEYRKSYGSAQAKYEQAVKPIIKAYRSKVEEAKINSARGLNAADSLSGSNNTNTSVPMPDLPEFNFEFRDEIDLGHMHTVLPVPVFETLLEVLEIPAEDIIIGTGPVTEMPSLSPDTSTISYQHIYSMIDTEIAANTDVIIEHTPTQENTSVSIGGVIIPIISQNPAGFPFYYQICPKTYRRGLFGGRYVNFDLSFEVTDPSWQVLSVDTTIEKHSGEKVTRMAFIQNRNGNNIMLTNLHDDALTSGDFYNIMKNLTVVVTFTNGAKKSLTANFSGTLNCISGQLTDLLVPIFDPEEDPIKPTPGAEGTFIPSGFGVKQLGIADYKKVEQTVQGYVEGEVAAIENIMAREYKEKATRRLRRSENTLTASSETEKEQLSDTTSTDRFEMQSEVAKILQESKDFSAGASFSADWGDISLGANVNMASHSSKEESNRQAVTQAKEVTERAMERIVTKVKQERIEKIVEEFEENNKHGFDNTKGDKHVVGVYRWVDKVFKNQVFNYGKRLMFEFMVPEPAKLHLLGMAENPMGTKLVKPEDPRTFADPAGTAVLLNMKDYNAVNDVTVKFWGSKFNVELTPAPVEIMSVGKSFSFTAPETIESEWEESAAGNNDIALPEGYYTTHAKVGWHISNEPGIGFRAIAGGQTAHNYDVPISKYVGSIPVSYSSLGYHSGSANFEIKLALLPEAKIKWQQETFRAIIEAYEEALTAYEQKLAEENAKKTNPGSYRQIENMVLRKNCISYLMDQDTAAKRTYGKDMGKPLGNGVKRTFGNHEIKVDAHLDDYAAFVKFMEQAFEWDIMSYNFYPYYWGARAGWANLYQYENNDPLFRSFMQAGMARVIVTVKPGFEEAVGYYLQTGQIWNGGEVPVIEDKLFLSIVDELRQPAGQKEGKAWATRLPTALTILQADSIGLKVNKALPYDEDLSDFEDPAAVPKSSNFEITSAQLGGSKTIAKDFISTSASNVLFGSTQAVSNPLNPAIGTNTPGTATQDATIAEGL